jgi:hypothetical protein
MSTKLLVSAEAKQEILVKVAKDESGNSSVSIYQQNEIESIYYQQ